MAEAKKAAPAKAAPGKAAKAAPKADAAKDGNAKGPKHTPATPKPRGRRKTRIGYVVSDKMEKTIVVELEDRMRHALYGKIIRTTKKVKAHDENSTAGVGDRVALMETRPTSATKPWAPVENLERGKGGPSSPKRYRNARDFEVSGVLLCRAGAPPACGAGAMRKKIAISA